MMKKRKLPKYKSGGFTWKGAANTLKDTGMFIGDMALNEIAPNAIRQDQYDNSAFGKNLGNVAAVTESLSSQSPLAKLGTSIGYRGAAGVGNTGYNQTQVDLYNKAMPIAKVGSKIGETYLNGITGGLTSGVFSTLDQASQRNYQAPSYMKYGGRKYYNGGMMYKNGGINSEIEGDETVSVPNGTNPQAFSGGELTPMNSQGDFISSGLNHENGGIGTNLPNGTKILSKRLKNPYTNKSFAKTDEILSKKIGRLEDREIQDKTTRDTIELLNKQKDDNFNIQEGLKQSKYEAGMNKAYMKYGGKMNRFAKKIEETHNKLAKNLGIGEYKDGGIQKYTIGGEQFDPNETLGLQESNNSIDPQLFLQMQQQMGFSNPQATPINLDDSIPTGGAQGLMGGNGNEYNQFGDWTNYAKLAPLVYNTIMGLRKSKEIPENKFTINNPAKFRPTDRASLYNKINSARLAGISNITNSSGGAGAIQLANQQGLNASTMNARYNMDLNAQMQDEARRQFIETQQLGVDQFNSQQRRQNYIMNQQALANRRAALAKASTQLGQLGMDTKRNRLEQYKMGLIPQVYPQMEYLFPELLNYQSYYPQFSK